jgi:uridine kinase
MPYEMPMYKAKLFDEFARWTEEYKDDPLRADAYERASRVYKLMQSLEPIKDDSIVPENSVIREFIGGSIYEY